ncbi:MULTISPECIES: TIGR03749 family integrating conjugative element protein [Pseudomonadota]|jgi:integrating conjugative element protein (TIGR03749 family)|uniref:TIGR03749 family integrating conjugative element protein n=1 Tax=Pseudomonadota TaxID=1224 RepID=UPI001B7BB6E5|nr:TIGR03749 family integrating conjugative element protein [Achromobacter xylosoxidans]MBP7654930.1 TIGR03749 family integrating conjugative element protein [Pseudoxanthomonas sp.]MCH4578106.1 TIGR03749 family integrating conjugative element protein [Achromobacter xylosoxidans]
MIRATAWLGPVLFALFVPAASAVEILRWERLPLAVPLTVGRERIVFVDRNVRIGVPASVGDRLRAQSAGGAVYLRASEPIEPTRLQLQDADSGALILLDIAAHPAKDGEAALEPIRIVEGGATATRYGDQADATAASATPRGEPAARRETPVPVILTRHAAQQLYAPLRTVEPVAGVLRVNLRRDLDLRSLLPTEPVSAEALAGWRLEDQWVTAVRLTNAGADWVQLDPRALQGDFLTATFQHSSLGPRGTPEDTTVVYLVTRGRGLAQSLLPAIPRIDPTVHVPVAAPVQGEGGDDAQ